jgi:hypothetical protein
MLSGGPQDAELAAGTAVRVRFACPPGHTRTPFYVRGKSGVIERFVGRLGNPEALGYGLAPMPKLALYRVRFGMAEIWGDYSGASADTLDVEIYEHWLIGPGKG